MNNLVDSKLFENQIANNLTDIITSQSPAHLCFGIPEIAQQIFAFVLISKYFPQYNISLYSNTVNNIWTVSKNFYTQAHGVKKTWAQKSLLPLENYYDLKTGNDVVNLMIAHQPFIRVNVSRITDFSASHLKELVEREQKICTLQINEQAINEWPIMESLTELYTSRKCTDNNLISMSQSFPNLQKIHLDYTKVTDISLKILANTCPKLRVIFVGKTKITDETIKALAKRCLNLNFIRLDDTGVTVQGLELLAKAYYGPFTIWYRETQFPAEDLLKLEKKYPSVEYVELKKID